MTTTTTTNPEQKITLALTAVLNPTNEKLARFSRYTGLATVGPTIEQKLHPTTSAIQEKLRPYILGNEALAKRLIESCYHHDPEASTTTVSERTLSLLIASYFTSVMVNRK